MMIIKVVCGIIWQGDKVFIAKKMEGKFMAGHWEFPGGKIEKDEMPETALRREIKEELAADIKVDRLLGTVDYDYPQFHLTMECYLCHAARGTLTILEHSAFQWMKKEELENVDWLGADRIAVEWMKQLPILL